MRDTSALGAHAQKWFWIQNNYADICVLGPEFFEEKVSVDFLQGEQNIDKKIQELITAPEKIQEKKKELLQTFPPDDVLRSYIDIVEKFAEMQDGRKAFVLRANHHHRLLLEKVAVECGQPIESLWFYTWHELEGAVTSRQFLSVKEIEKRTKMIVEVQSKKEKVLLVGDEGQFFYEKLQEEVGNVKSLSGIVA